MARRFRPRRRRGRRVRPPGTGPAFTCCTPSRCPSVGQPEYEYPPEFGDAIRTRGDRVVRGLVDVLSRENGDVKVSGAAVEDDPTHALIEASVQASLTVVGSRGRGRLREVVLGSVALRVASRAHSPVAVVNGAPGDPDGPVVVAADGAARSDAAVAFAFQEAANRRADLVAVLGWDVLGQRPYDRRPTLLGLAEDDTGESVLSRQLAGWCEKYPEVSVRPVVYRGPAAEALLEPDTYGAPAPQLIVLGSRGRGAVAGLMLGSTSHTVITHAPCPVIVARPDGAR